MTGIEIATIGGMSAASAAAAGTPWLAGTAITLADAAVAAGTILGVASGIGQAQSAKAAGAAQQQAANYQAGLMAQQAGQERAVAQRKAESERKQKDLVQSRLQAVSAASGAGALDPTVTDLVGDVEREGEYRAMTAMYEGEERARGLESGAAGRVYEGQIARMQGNAAARSAYMRAGGSLLQGGYALGNKFFPGKSGLIGQTNINNIVSPSDRTLFSLGGEDSLYLKYR